jgi:tripartite-type tricarboxylate transporter receptor subunit TctC
MKHFLRGWLTALALGFASFGGAMAAPYPDHPVKLIVPYAPGGGADVLGRVLAQHLGNSLGQTFIVDNRPGGGAMIGADMVAKATPDGYTLLLGSSGELTISPGLYNREPYDPVNAFVPVSLLGSSPAILVANLKYPGKNLNDVIAYAKANPGKLSFGSGGTGTPPHLAGELLKNVAGIDIVHIPYKGGGPLESALLSGEVEIGFTTIASTQAQLRAGQVKALSVISQKRTSLLPDVPSAGEQGLKGYEVLTWYGLFAPANTPEPVVQALRGAVSKALADKEFLKSLERLGIELGTVEQREDVIRTRIKTELASWRALLKKANITAQ